jgi:cell division septation protein DedD
MTEAAMEPAEPDSAEIRAFEEQARLEAARRDSIREALERTRIVYDEKGRYVVQLSAWRSMAVAESHVEMWKQRGFNSSYLATTGDASTGDVWYRVRIGRFADRAMAERVRGILATEHGTESWIGTWEGGS